MNEQNQMNNPTSNGEIEKPKGNFGWAVLGFFIPIVGWILYFVWKQDRPGDAKMAGIGGLVGFGVSLLLNIVVLGSFIRQVLQ